MFARAYAFSMDPFPGDFPLPSDDVGFGHLAISPGYRLARIVVNGRHVILLGHCVDLDNPDLDEGAIARRLVEAESVPEAAFNLLGRFVVIDHRNGRTRVCGDATAMRTAYYADDAPVVASHSTLVGLCTGAPAPLVDAFRYYRFGLPGNLSPVPGVRVVPPNFVLDLDTRELRRFWPTPNAPRTERSVDDVYPTVERLLLTSADALRRRARCVLSLTAGIDSRVSLAALRSQPDTITFTYDRGLEDAIDMRIAPDIAKRVDLEHRRLPLRRADRSADAHADSRALVDYRHDVQLPTLYERAFGGQNLLHVRSNLLEIGRSFWRQHAGEYPTVDAIAWHERNMYRSDGLPHYDEARAIFDEEMPRYFELLGYADAESFFGYDPFDLFYWEHRMPMWHSQLVLGTDAVFETSVLFNSRVFLSTLLEVPLADRKAATLMHRFIAAQAPEIAGVPINPGRTRWEELQRNAQKARGRIERTLRR